jgi:signal transduction histidine kinase
VDSREAVLLRTLEALLRIDVTDLRAALTAASDVVAAALRAEKVDVFVLEQETSTLVALGTSTTPLGQKQKQLGLDRLPLESGGHTVGVFRTGEPFASRDLRDDPDELRGIVEALGIRSVLLAPAEVPGRPRGILSVTSVDPGRWSQVDLGFASAVGSWIGQVMHRAHLVEDLAAASREEGRRAAANDLVTTLAHELRNLLSPLSGRLTLLERRAARDLRDADRRDVELATRSLRRLTKMVEDLLDVGRIDAGLLQLDPAPTDLAALVHSIAEEMEEEGHAIEVRAPGELVAPVDPRVRHVVENLVANAVKHSPPAAAIRIEVTRERAQDGACAVVRVWNSGEGIAPALLPRLFDRFARGSASTGLGLGLYLARGIARAHGGDVTAESAPGEGTSFRVRLPLAPRITARGPEA